MNLQRRERLSRLRVAGFVAVLIAAAAVPTRAPGACPDCYSFVALDAAGDPAIVLARGVQAAASGDLFGNAAEEWVAALAGGGLFVRPGDGSPAGLIPLVDARALAMANRRLIVALRAGGILSLDLEGDEASPLSALSAVALAAADLDGDGAAELAALLGDGGLVIIDPSDGETLSLENVRGAAIAGGDFLARGHDQLAVLGSSGILQILDLLEGDSSLCFFGSGLHHLRPRGLSALPSGHLVTLDPGGSIVALDPRSCESFHVSLSGLDVAHEPIFTSIREPTSILPPCPIDGVTCSVAPESDRVEVSWSVLSAPDCGCQRFEVRGDAGAVLATADGGSRAAFVPCENVSPGGRLEVVCVGSSGEEMRGECMAPACSTPGGAQRPGDCNDDGNLDLSDAICLLGHLYLGRPVRLPCGDGTTQDTGNRMLLDSNGDQQVNLSDPIYVLLFLFNAGQVPVLGKECVSIPDCPETCRS